MSRLRRRIRGAGIGAAVIVSLCFLLFVEDGFFNRSPELGLNLMWTFHKLGEEKTETRLWSCQATKLFVKELGDQAHLAKWATEYALFSETHLEGKKISNKGNAYHGKPVVQELEDEPAKELVGHVQAMATEILSFVAKDVEVRVHEGWVNVLRRGGVNVWHSHKKDVQLIIVYYPSSTAGSFVEFSEWGDPYTEGTTESSRKKQGLVRVPIRNGTLVAFPYFLPHRVPSPFSFSTPRISIAFDVKVTFKTPTPADVGLSTTKYKTIDVEKLFLFQTLLGRANLTAKALTPVVQDLTARLATLKESEPQLTTYLEERLLHQCGQDCFVRIVDVQSRSTPIGEKVIEEGNNGMVRTAVSWEMPQESCRAEEESALHAVVGTSGDASCSLVLRDRRQVRRVHESAKMEDRAVHRFHAKIDNVLLGEGDKKGDVNDEHLFERLFLDGLYDLKPEHISIGQRGLLTVFVNPRTFKLLEAVQFNSLQTSSCSWLQLSLCIRSPSPEPHSRVVPRQPTLSLYELNANLLQWEGAGSSRQLVVPLLIRNGDSVFVGMDGPALIGCTTQLDQEDDSGPIGTEIAILARCPVVEAGEYKLFVTLEYTSGQGIQPIVASGEVGPGNLTFPKDFLGRPFQSSPVLVKAKRQGAQNETAFPFCSIRDAMSEGRWKRKASSKTTGDLAWKPLGCQLTRYDKALPDLHKRLVTSRLCTFYFVGDSLMRYMAMTFTKRFLGGEMTLLTQGCTVGCGKTLKSGASFFETTLHGVSVRVEYYNSRGMYSKVLDKAKSILVGVADRARQRLESLPPDSRSVLVYNSGLHDLISVPIQQYSENLAELLRLAKRTFPGTVIWKSTADTHMRSTKEYQNAVSKERRSTGSLKSLMKVKDVRPLEQLNLMTRDRIVEANSQANAVAARLGVPVLDVFATTHACWTPACMLEKTDIRHYSANVDVTHLNILLQQILSLHQ